MNFGLSIKNRINSFLQTKYYEWRFDDICHVNCDINPVRDKRKLDIVTVAFNNDDVISHQIRLLKKNLSDPYCYTVADNSPDLVKQKKIQEICQSNGIPYFKLPKNSIFKKNPSFSHGLALNWVFRNYIRPRKALYFGFLDHDIFPFVQTKIIEHLEKSCMYGLIQERGKKWYFWGGFCFYKTEFIENIELDFRPIDNLDTGGGNWEALYAHFEKSNVPWIKHEYQKLREGDDPQADWIEYIGDWVHTFNASKWKKETNKDHLVHDFLNKL